MGTTTDFDSQPPSFGPEPIDWSIPIWQIGNRRIHLSYNVLFALAIILGSAALFTRSAGNRDLVFSICIAALIWCAGIFVQTLAYGLSLSGPGAIICIGIAGVLWQSSAFPAKRTLLASLTTVSLLVVIGCGMLLASRWSLDSDSIADPAARFSFAALETASVASLLNLGGGLILLQLVIQLYPLRHSLGRSLLSSMVICLTSRFNPLEQARLIHRLLLMISIATGLLTVWSLRTEQPLYVPRWPLLMLVALLLAFTSRLEEIRRLVDSLRFIPTDATDEKHKDDSWEHAVPEVDQDPPLRESWWGQLRAWPKRRRLRRTIARERSEAMDAEKLDEILRRLHQHGIESLSEDDRSVLKRVSETLKSHRSGLGDH